MAGYIGYSMSVNAKKARDEGMLPVTDMVRLLKKRGFRGLTTRLFRMVIKPAEWHHTSKFYNSTDFYSIESVWENRRELRRLVREERLFKKAKKFKQILVEYSDGAEWEPTTWIPFPMPEWYKVSIENGFLK